MVVEYKHKIGFKGTILIEPKPKEPTKHQYDYDVGTIFGMLKAFGLEKEVKLNIEQNHAILAGHSFEHEIALAAALGIFGSLDINRGDYLSRLGHRPVRHERAGADARLLRGAARPAASRPAALNFDAKIRRQSIDPDDLLHAHVASMDACARACINAAAHDRGRRRCEGFVDERYAGWETEFGQHIVDGGCTLEDLAKHGRGEAPRSATPLRPPGISGRTRQPLHLSGG